MPNGESDSQKTIVVVGNGATKAAPDVCTVALSLVVRHDSVADAISDISGLADEVLAAVRESGVADTDVSTQSISVHETMDHERQRVTGHVATYTFTVVVRDLDAVSSLVASLASIAGDALQIQWINLAHSNPAALLAEARRGAVADAKACAVELADAAGVQLGDILTINEGSGMNGGWIGRAVSSSAMPIAPGEESVTAQVTIKFALI